ncbi:hypothetical protein SDC9_13765 [bioreactor metagenome]|uniref:Uncharacterized protein n=1 Tax=bioreactor metagenome TaxID=1076179 RepID=A0A644TP45_9ZZZZ|nr:hypothetical protein [Negativicutes bacterium]
MGIFTEIRNECLIKELQRELNTDVLLFGFDGMVYFGRLQKVEDCRVATLMAPEEASNVEIQTPSGENVEVRFAHVDLWQIVAKATGVKTNPFDSGYGKGPAAGLPERTDTTERQESHELICILRRMIGDEVAITTLGGFLFTGTLGDVDDELAFISVDDIFIPGTSSQISDDDVSTAVINLEAITSVSLLNCTC